MRVGKIVSTLAALALAAPAMAQPEIVSDSGDTAWILTASALVLMMTMPDLGFTRGEFIGRVRGDAMEGVVKLTLPPKTEEEDEELETLVLPWQAKRVATSGFFAPAGTDVR